MDNDVMSAAAEAATTTYACF